ncbi:hypothetical protein CBER1_11443 [Cercospora berteroae]|uniref:Uncharacterized protein n=1 Tax=Cercospora berteroae TaxID=357750 RepID=A0A2S6BZA0_9PEZI|nr:hypothetical protein CBER1_11443 [Cercospora berteroae]
MRSPAELKKRSPGNMNNYMSVPNSIAHQVSQRLKDTNSRVAAALDNFVSHKTVVATLKCLATVPGVAQIAVAISAAWFSFFSLFSEWSRYSKVSKMEAPHRITQSKTTDFSAMAHKGKARNRQHHNGRVELIWAKGKADTGQATHENYSNSAQLLQYTLYVVTDIRFIAYFCILAVVFTWLRDRGMTINQSTQNYGGYTLRPELSLAYYASVLLTFNATSISLLIMRFFGPGVLCLLISGINASPVKPAVSPRDAHLDHEAFLDLLNPRGTLDGALKARQIKDKKPNGKPFEGNSEEVAACRISHLRMKGCDVNKCISAVAWRGGTAHRLQLRPDLSPTSKMKSVVSAMPPHLSLPGEEPWILTEHQTASSRPLEKVESEHKMTAGSKNESTGNTPTSTQPCSTLPSLKKPKIRPASFRTVLHTLVDGVADTTDSIMCKELAIGMMALLLVLKLILASAFVQAIVGVSVASILLDLIIFTMIKPKTQLQVSERDPQKKAGSKTIRHGRKESTKPKSDAFGQPDRMTTILMMTKIIFISVLLDCFLWGHGGAQTTHLGDYSCVVDSATGLPTSCVLV